MEIEKINVTCQTLEEFATEHVLTLVVQEQSMQMIGDQHCPRFTACFKNVRMKGESAWETGIEVFGYGDKEADAVTQYMLRISGKTLLTADGEIKVPRLISVLTAVNGKED